MGRIMDRVKRAAERGGWESPATKAAKRLGGLLSRDLVIQVLKNPAAFNRRTRRSVGLYLPLPTPVGKRLAPASQRYIRRHGDVLGIIKASRNRRQRRHAARIERLAIRRGM